MTRAHISMLALIAASCTPTLTDGAYSCADGGTCPPGWQCRSDQRCHAMPADTGVPCREDDECASGTCSVDVPGSSAGYCTIACAGDADCNELGAGARCLASHCLIPCAGAADCPTGTSCQMPHEPRTQPPTSGSCAAIDDPAFNGATACPSFENCQPPGFCIASTDPTVGSVGVCSMWCNDDSNCVGGRCVALLRAPDDSLIRHCLLECFPGTGDVCTNGLVCARLGAGGPGGTLCIPTAWVDHGVPLPGELAMPMQ